MKTAPAPRDTRAKPARAFAVVEREGETVGAVVWAKEDGEAQRRGLSRMTLGVR